MHQQSPPVDDLRLPNHTQSFINVLDSKDGTKSGVRFAFSRSAARFSLPLDRSQLAHLSALDYLRAHTHPTSKRLRVYHMCFPHSIDPRTKNFLHKRRVSLLELQIAFRKVFAHSLQTEDELELFELLNLRRASDLPSHRTARNGENSESDPNSSHRPGSARNSPSKRERAITTLEDQPNELLLRKLTRPLSGSHLISSHNAFPVLQTYDFQAFVGICALTERLLYQKYLTPETAELEGYCHRNQVELADFSGIQRQLGGLTLSPSLAAVLTIINTS